jgi:hypothetical protein
VDGVTLPALTPLLLDDPPAQWAARLIRGATPDGQPLPLYGSAEWEQAPAPVKLASALRAAEAHRRGPLFDAQRLDAEMRQQWQQIDQAQWELVAGRVRAMGRADCPSHAQLAERRAEVTRPAGYQPRPWAANA